MSNKTIVVANETFDKLEREAHKRKMTISEYVSYLVPSTHSSGK
jgi:macrodomain Ter protein organizer (MatP/YcbG family)